MFPGPYGSDHGYGDFYGNHIGGGYGYGDCNFYIGHGTGHGYLKFGNFSLHYYSYDFYTSFNEYDANIYCRPNIGISTVTLSKRKRRT